MEKVMMKKNSVTPTQATDAAPADQVSTNKAKGVTRRQILGTGAAAAMTLAAGWSSAARALTPAPRIVIVGAGLAGLRCAHSLWNRSSPIASTVYDADTSHVGGRCWSLRGFFD